LAALRYILECAGKKTRIVVVPLSSENYDGPHDGTSLFESALDALVIHAARLGKDMRVVISAGNGSRAQTHARIDVPSIAPLRVRVLPGNERPTFMELWVPAHLEPAQVSIQPPGAVQPIVCAPDMCSMGTHSRQAVVSAVSMPQGAFGNPRFQYCILVRIASTLVTTGHGAPAGDWQFSIDCAQGRKGAVFAFIARSTHGLGGHRRSYQSHFVTGPTALAHPDVEDYSLNGLANGQEPWVVGGYRLSDRSHATYSARGPSRPGGRFKNTGVDSAAPSEESVTLSGLRSWGNTSAASVRLGGTSVAAPLAAHVARKPERPGRAESTDAADRPLLRADIVT
jgi:subtilisin family serine protease